MKGSFDVIWADNGCIIIEKGKSIKVVERHVDNIDANIGSIFTDIETGDRDYINELDNHPEDVGGFRVDFTMTPISKIGDYEDI